MKKVSLECDNCGAKVPARQAQPGVHKCEYCGHEFRIAPTQQPRPKPAPAPRPAPQRPRRASTPRGGKRGAGAVAIVAVFVAMGAALGAWLLVSKDMGGGKSGSKVLSSVLGERLTWDHVGGDPVPVDVGGAEHIVGRVRSQSRDGQLSIMVVNARTLKPLWRTPDLGTYSEAYRAIRYAVVGDRVLVSDKRNVLHVHDAKDGKELKTHKVTDRVEQLCPMKEGSAVWVQVLDKRHLTFDVKSFAAEEALKRPAHCPRSVFMSRHRRPRLRRRIKGMRPRRLFRQGELAVVLGEKYPGTKVPVVAGVEPKRRGKVLWQKPLAAVDQTSVRTSFNRWFGGIGGKRFIAPYGVGSKAWRVVALDAQTGDQLWDVTLRELFAVDHIKAFVVTEGLVYIGRTSSLEVLDAKDGKLLGAVGTESYRR
jgi:hypothetical protein